MTKRYRISSKFRFTLFAAAAVLCIFTVFSTLLGFNTVNSSSMTEYYQIQIQPGDTLWEIASEYGPDNSDVRKTVREICSLNDISADQLEPGQRIIVPVYE
ncbi:MAG: LysM peptidoglycan-binding domain-containing protein [Emergencia sp.]